MRQPVEADLAQAREPGEMRDARVGDARALPELETLERWQASEDLEAAIGNPGLSGIVRFQPRQACHMTRRDVAGVAAVHAPQGFQLLASANVAKSLV